MLSKSRYTIHIPVRDNNGRDLHGLIIQAGDYLAEQFGGFTRHDALGGWLDGARHYREPVVVFTVDTDLPDGYDIMSTLALVVKRRADQERVYLTRQPIDVELI